jgi:hypothetical protein
MDLPLSESFLPKQSEMDHMCASRAYSIYVWQCRAFGKLRSEIKRWLLTTACSAKELPLLNFSTCRSNQML